MIRILDFIFSLLLIVFSFPLTFTIFVISSIKKIPPFFFQERVGLNKKPFILIKFRTMHPNTKSVASHLVDPKLVYPFGRFLRKSKIDELPQLLNVLKGDMSLVGPRPCLFNQKELIHEREKRNIFNFQPGITGLAQIKSIDMSNPRILAETEMEMITNFNIKNYFIYLFFTLLGRGFGDKIERKK
tara:strand:- start:266 stop:823 length:558 start_codon:yes stop_codon:yes gene_type:complete